VNLYISSNIRLSYFKIFKSHKPLTSWIIKILIAKLYLKCIYKGVRGRLLVRIPTRTLNYFMWGSYPASLRNVGGSTQVPVHAWNNARKGTWGLSPSKLKRRDKPILFRCDVKPNKNTYVYIFERKKIMSGIYT
jgi:hypothetical protein